MFEVIVVADDLTGANATGVLLKNIGIETLTLLKNVKEIDWGLLNDEFQGVVIPTHSRSDSKEDAYAKVLQVTKEMLAVGGEIFNKRIDSTLRGNLGAEIDAMLDALGGERIALVVPAYPLSGRKCLGGFLMVDGVILQNTNAGRDPKSPVLDSNVKRLIEKQSYRKVVEIHIDFVESNKVELHQKIMSEVNDGAKIIVFDAMTDEHIGNIAMAANLLLKPFITVGPGPFVREVAKQKREQNKKTGQKKVLMTIGSVTNLTMKQILHLMSEKEVLFQKVDVQCLLNQENDEKFIRDIVDEIQHSIKEYDLICLTTTDLNGHHQVDLNAFSHKLQIDADSISLRINNVLAEITKELVDNNEEIKGLFTSGGDTTLAIAACFNMESLHIEGEVYPLAVSGSLEKSSGRCIDIVTKGGLIGEEDGLLVAVDYLLKRINKKE